MFGVSLGSFLESSPSEPITGTNLGGNLEGKTPSLLENILGIAGGSLLSGGLELGGDLISNLFNKEARSATESGKLQGEAQAGYAKELMPVMGQMNEKAMYSAAGLTGKTAGDVARQKIEGLTPTAGAMSTASGLRGDAAKMNAQVAQQANIGNALAARQEGALRNILAATPAGSPAARMAMLSKAGEISGENRAKAMQQTGAQIQAAAQQKASNLAGAQDVLQKDLKTGFDTKVAPYLTQVNTGMTSQLLGGQAVPGATQASEGMYVSNPLGDAAAKASMLSGAQAGINIGTTAFNNMFPLQKAWSLMPDTSYNNYLSSLYR